MNPVEQQQPVKRGPGRPPKQGEIKRAFFQTRIRESLKQRLEASAAEQGRSLSEQIELRLEGSYSRLEDRFGGKIGLDLALMLFSSFEFAGRLRGAIKGGAGTQIEQWLADPQCFEAALLALVDSVLAHHPRPVTQHDFDNFCTLLRERRIDRQERKDAEATLAGLQREEAMEIEQATGPRIGGGEPDVEAA